MSVSVTDVYMIYAGDGTTVSFPIVFDAFTADQVSVFLIDDATGEITTWVEGVDYDVVFTPYDPMFPTMDAIKPESITATVAPSLGATLWVGRDTALTQVIHYINNAAFKASDHEKGLDRIVMMIQEVARQAGLAVKIHPLDEGNVAVQLPRLEPNMVLVVNEDGDGFEWKTPAEIVGDASGGLVDSVDGETGAIEYNGSFYSTRFSETFTFTSLRDFIDQVILPGYAPPSVSLTSNVGTGPYEVGDPITAINFSANVGLESNLLTQVVFSQSGTPFSTQTSGGAIPNGGTSTAAWSGSISNTTTYSVAVTDDSGNPATVANRTFNYVRPYFWGTGATDTLTAANVAALTKDIRASSASVERTYSATGGNYFYFAQPASYPVITKIFDVNGFEVQGNFTSFTGDYTALDGSTQSLRVYRNVAPIGVDTYLRFVR